MHDADGQRPARAAAHGKPGRHRRARRSPTGAPDADLVDLDARVGRLVRVGGLVVDLEPDGFTLDDGTAIGRVVLRGDGARAARPHRARRRAQRDRPGRSGGRPARSSSSTTRRASSRPATRSPRRRQRRHRRRSPGPSTAPVRHTRDARCRGRSARRPGRHAAVRRRDRRPRDAGRDLGRIGGRDAPPTGSSRRRLAARIAGRLATFAAPSGDPPGGPSAGERRLSVGQARSTRLDARENAGLSSAEFRASEAAT